MTARPGFGAKAAQQAMAFLTSLLENDEVKEETRLKAAGMILERTVPKTTAACKPADGKSVAPAAVKFGGELETWSR